MKIDRRIVSRSLALAACLTLAGSTWAGPVVAGPISFAPAVELAPGTDATGVALGDLDGDGDLDLVAVDAAAGTVSRLDNAAGDASAWTVFPMATGLAGARAVALGDLDRDGDLDAVVAAETDDAVAWLENTAGDGSAWARHDVDASFDGGVDVELVDVDADGDLDVIAAGAGGDLLAVWRNAGDGSAWTEIQALGSFDAQSVAVADFDADGDPDLLSASFASSEVRFAVNASGDGSTWTGETVSTGHAGPRDAAVGDVDGDGDPDVLWAAETAGVFAWVESAWTENADGSWIDHAVAAGEPGPVAVAVVDLDADGDLDLLGANNDGSVRWWESSASGGTWTKHTIADALEPGSSVGVGADLDLAAVDLDADGDLDVVATVGGTVTWWQNRTYHRSAAFGDEQGVTTGLDGAMGLRPADLDGDGDLDLAGTAWFADRILWWENTLGTGDVWVEHGIDDGRTMAREVFPVDMDRDGDLDLLASVLGEDTVSWWENTAGDASAWTEHVVDTAFVGARSLFPLDMDGDGDSDILGAALYGDLLAWWENLGGAGWTRHTIDTVDGVGWVYAADFDGDGDLDVTAALAGASNRVSWWRNTSGDGSAWSAEQVLGTDLEEANYVHAGDLNGDGHVDVLSATMRGDRIAWWQNPGGPGPWTEHTVDDEYVGPYTVISADLDADGDQDIAVAALFGNRVSWFENVDGTALSWVEHTVGLDFEWGRSVRVADLDGDGDLDLAASASNGDRVSWWRQQGGQYALPTTDAMVSATPDEGSESVLLLRVEARHLGRDGDGDLALGELRLAFEMASETSTGTPLTAAELHGTVSAIGVHRDDGDGIFSASTDPVAIVASSPFAPSAEGELALVFPESDPLAEVAHGSDAVFFVTVDLTSTASLAVPGGFRAVHRAEASRAESDTGLVLAVEPQGPVASAVLDPQNVGAVFSDAFETGDASAWSAASNPRAESDTLRARHTGSTAGEKP